MLTYSLLHDESWIAFNTHRWNCTAKRLCFGSEGVGPRLNAVLYLKHGKIIQPKRNPYMPIEFAPGATSYLSKRNHQWLRLASEMIQAMKYYGLSSAIDLTPDIGDVRPWLWDGGFGVGIKYTYLIKLPYSLDTATKNYRNRIRRARRVGLTCERTQSLREVHSCIAPIEARLSFTNRVSLKDLELAQEFLGHEKFRVYVCRTPQGDAVSASIALYGGSGVAIGWIGGTKTEYMHNGAAQFVEACTLEDLGRSGAIYYDLWGADLPNIANSKSFWNGDLVCYSSIYSRRFHDRAAGLLRKAAEVILSKL